MDSQTKPRQTQKIWSNNLSFFVFAILILILKAVINKKSSSPTKLVKLPKNINSKDVLDIRP